MQTIEFVIMGLLVVLIFLVLGIGWIFYRKSKQKTDQTINQNLDQLTPTLENINKSVNQQYEMQHNQSKESVAKWTETLTKINTTSQANEQKFFELKQEVNSLKDQQIKMLSDNQLATLHKLSNLIDSVQKVDEQVIDLNRIFYNTKQRGSLGEFTLETLLTDILGKDSKVWESQYSLAVDGNSSSKGNVDFIIHTANKGDDIILDSKFPLDNYLKLFKEIEEKANDLVIKETKEQFKRDIKTKITEVTKYINDKNHVNSAILFLPSESIFNFIVDKFPELIKLGIDKKVWLTGPTGLAALLNIINQYAKDYELTNNLSTIKDLIVKIKPNFLLFAERWEKIKSDLNKINDDVKKLDITTDKIIKQQQNIVDYQFDDELNQA